MTVVTPFNGSECVIVLKQKASPLDRISCRGSGRNKYYYKKRIHKTIGTEKLRPHLFVHNSGAGVYVSLVILHGFFFVELLDVLEHGVLNSIGVDYIEGTAKSFDEGLIFTNLSIYVGHTKPSSWILTSCSSDSLKSIPLRIVGGNGLSSLCLALAVLAPHCRNESQAINLDAAFESIAHDGHNEFGLIIAPSKTKAGDGVVDGRIGESLGDQLPVTLKAGIRHGGDGGDDFELLKAVKEWRNHWMLHGFMDILDTKKCSGVAQRSVPTVQDANFH